MHENLYKDGYVRTYSGIYFNLKKPNSTDVYLMDIAVSLARECRFINTTKKMYSVAEHSVYCSLIAEERYPEKSKLPFLCLLHDAHEYIWKDLPTPIKNLIPGYRSLQLRTQDAIHERYNVFTTQDDRKLIAQIDKAALEYEWQNRVLKHAGVEMDEKSRIEYFLYHFKRLCKTPYVLQP